MASIVPGSVSAVSNLLNAGVYFFEGKYDNCAKCAVQAGVTLFGGNVIGAVANLSTKARVITSISLIGAGMYTAATSGYDFIKNFTSLVSEFSKGENSNTLTKIHYMSGIFTSVAGMAYGVGSIAGGISGFNGITSADINQISEPVKDTNVVKNKSINYSFTEEKSIELAVYDPEFAARQLLDGGSVSEKKSKKYYS